MSKIKILVILSDIKKAKEHEWFCQRIDRDRFEVIFFQINAEGSEMDAFIRNAGFMTYHGRIANKIHLVPVIFRLMKLIRKHRIEVIHAHLFTGSFVGMIAGKLTGVPKRIHTRHHSNFHHTYHRSTVKYDRLINLLSTDIIAISKNVMHILTELENVPQGKVRLIYHGFDIDQFRKENVSQQRISDVATSHGIDMKRPVIGVISRYTHWKGIQYVIPAFRELLLEYSDLLLVLANAKGDYKKEIRAMLSDLPDESYIEIPFENDSAALYHTFDYFVHVPIDAESEAFGQVYIESLAACIPSVFTLSGIASEFIFDNENALVVSFRSSDDIVSAMKKLLSNSVDLPALTSRGLSDVQQKFSIDRKVDLLQELYSG
jgi:glycosyltransferase involved in cell wall biosynthesis